MRIIEVLGPGCRNCQTVDSVVREVVKALGIAAEIRHVTEYADIAARGVMSTPGLVIDGVVVSAGRIPTREQVTAHLEVA